MLIKQRLQMLLMPSKRVSFLKKLNSNATILDVGCGNNSPFKTKEVLSNCIYTGIDIHDYNQNSKELADEYIVADKINFHQSINNLNRKFDAVISAHNLEHCINRKETLLAMLNSVKPGGFIYLAFPCEESIHFPSRKGTLNYFDDKTHTEHPPELGWIIEQLNTSKFTVTKLVIRHQPKIVYLIGFLLEPISALVGKILPGTWEFYGFETIIWAKKSF